MKKLVLGVVALGVIVNVAWAYNARNDPCRLERHYYSECLKQQSGPYAGARCFGPDNIQTPMFTLEQLELKFKACLVENGLY